MNADELLDRLRSVKPSGQQRWMALCPAHDDTRGRSLSIREDNGRILLHCFAGCDVVSICGAIGLELKDLMPPSLARGRHHDLDAHRVPCGALLEFIDHEALVVWNFAQILKKRGLKAEEWRRLTAATRRISDARALIAPARKGHKPRAHLEIDRIRKESK